LDAVSTVIVPLLDQTLKSCSWIEIWSDRHHINYQLSLWVRILAIQWTCNQEIRTEQNRDLFP